MRQDEAHILSRLALLVPRVQVISDDTVEDEGIGLAVEPLRTPGPFEMRGLLGRSFPNQVDGVNLGRQELRRLARAAGLGRLARAAGRGLRFGRGRYRFPEPPQWRGEAPRRRPPELLRCSPVPVLVGILDCGRSPARVTFDARCMLRNLRQLSLKILLPS